MLLARVDSSARGTDLTLRPTIMDRTGNRQSRSWREGEAGRSRRTVAVPVIPLAFRKRTLFKMDFAEALYISELRSGPAGHFSYRNVAYAMYEAVALKISRTWHNTPRERM